MHFGRAPLASIPAKDLKPPMRSATHQAVPTQADTDQLRAFVEWAAERLDVGLETAVGGLFSLTIAEEHRDTFDGAERILYTFDPARYEHSGPDEVELVAPGGRLLSWLRERMIAAGNLSYAIPAGQPQSVHEISGKLFSAYTIEGGNVRLAGCHLEDRLVVRLQYRLTGVQTSEVNQPIELFVGPDGKPITPALIETLGLVELASNPGLPRVNDRQLIGLVNLARHSSADGVRRLLTMVATQQQLGAEKTSADDSERAVLVALDLISCKFAEGKLCFSIGEHTLEAPFSGWAGQLAALPCICPETGRSTHHLALTDDGRVAAAEEIETCAASGRRMLRSELFRCAETGRWLSPEFIETCPISGKSVSSDTMAECPVCGQCVARSNMSEGICSACRELKPVGRDDQRLRRVLKAHPGLARWRHWQLAETNSVYVIAALGLVRRLLIVVGKNQLEPRRVAQANRWQTAWRPLEPARYPDFLA